MMWVLITIAILAISWSLSLWVKHVHRKTGWVLIILAMLLTIFFVGGTVYCWAPPDREAEAPGYGVALGCGLENGQARPELVVRCMAALRWMEENPDSVLIVSGGDPTEQGVTEAAVMAAWLRNHGAEADRILLEPESTDTRENILFSQALAEENGLETDQITIITSDYHLTRAVFLANRAGQQAACVPAPTPLLVHFASAVREVYCMVSEILGI